MPNWVGVLLILGIFGTELFLATRPHAPPDSHNCTYGYGSGGQCYSTPGGN